MSNAIKGMSIQDLEASRNSQVWVLNNSNPKGIVNMVLPDGMGANMVVSIPVTWIPIDLTTQATKKSITVSPTFRRLVTMGIIKIINETQAQEMLGDPSARQEAERIFSMVSELTANPDTIPTQVRTLQSEASGAVSGFAMNLAGNSELDEDAAMNLIRNNESAMSVEDFKYIAENSAHAKVKAFAASKAVA